MDAFTFCIQQIFIFVLTFERWCPRPFFGGFSQELAAPVSVISPLVGVRVARSKVFLSLIPFYFWAVCGQWIFRFSPGTLGRITAVYSGQNIHGRVAWTAGLQP